MYTGSSGLRCTLRVVGSINTRRSQRKTIKLFACYKIYEVVCLWCHLPMTKNIKSFACDEKPRSRLPVTNSPVPDTIISKTNTHTKTDFRFFLKVLSKCWCVKTSWLPVYRYCGDYDTAEFSLTLFHFSPLPQTERERKGGGRRRGAGEGRGRRDSEKEKRRWRERGKLERAKRKYWGE